MTNFIKYTTITFLLMISTNSIASQQISINTPLKAKGQIYRVIDGDTFQINLFNQADYQRIKDNASKNNRRSKYLNDKYQSIIVRLATIDTEESVHPDESRNTEKGKETSRIVKKQFEKDNVDIWCYDFGYRGRIICNIKSNDDNVDIGSFLISNDLSNYYTKYGNNPVYHQIYIKMDK